MENTDKMKHEKPFSTLEELKRGHFFGTRNITCIFIFRNVSQK